MRKCLWNVQMVWYKLVMKLEGRKINQLIREGERLTSERLLEVSRRIDEYCVRCIQVRSYLR